MTIYSLDLLLLLSLTYSFWSQSVDESERGEWKSWLKTQHSKNKIMASGPNTSWQIDGETMETVTDFIFLGSRVTEDGDYSHEIKRGLLLGGKAMANLDSILKSRDIANKGLLLLLCHYGCESRTRKKAEHQRIATLEMWCWRRLLRVPWTARS